MSTKPPTPKEPAAGPSWRITVSDRLSGHYGSEDLAPQRLRLQSRCVPGPRAWLVWPEGRWRIVLGGEVVESFASEEVARTLDEGMRERDADWQRDLMRPSAPFSRRAAYASKLSRAPLRHFAPWPSKDRSRGPRVDGGAGYARTEAGSCSACGVLGRYASYRIGSWNSKHTHS